MRGNFNFSLAGRMSLSVVILYFVVLLFVYPNIYQPFIPTILGALNMIQWTVGIGGVLIATALHIRMLQKWAAILFILYLCIALPLIAYSMMEGGILLLEHQAWTIIYVIIVHLLLLFWTYTFGIKNPIKSKQY